MPFKGKNEPLIIWRCRTRKAMRLMRHITPLIRKSGIQAAFTEGLRSPVRSVHPVYRDARFASEPQTVYIALCVVLEMISFWVSGPSSVKKAV